MVTCPIDLFSTATVDLCERVRAWCKGQRNRPKPARAVELALALLGRNDRRCQTKRSKARVPRSKGMASSSADVAAAIGATAAALGEKLSIQQQAELALAVEPSDGVMLPGIALFDHKGGQMARSLGDPPDMRVLVLEFAGVVDTEAFNAVDRDAELQEARGDLPRGAAAHHGGAGQRRRRTNRTRCDAERFVTSNSSCRSRNCRRRWPWARPREHLGSNVAHSGTVVGMLFSGDAERITWAADAARTRLSGLTAVYNRKLIGGGVFLG